MAVLANQPEPELAVVTTAPKGIRKAAILITALGDRISGEVLRRMPEEEAHDLAREVSLLSRVSHDEREEVLREFHQLTHNPGHLITGGKEYATSVLLAAFGPDAGKRMAERLSKAPGDETPVVETLRKADPRNLAKVVQNEHPQSIALILGQLGSVQAAALLSALPQNVRTEAARRMAALDQISPEVINKLTRTVCDKLKLLGESNLESCGGVRSVADILNRVKQTTSEEILSGLDDEDAPLAASIRQMMFVFDDLLHVNADDLRVILSKLDRKVLTLSLKGSSTQVKVHFKSVLSSRAAEMLEEDLQALGPVRIRDVQSAQQQIIDEARKLQKDGKISLNSSGSEEFVE
jgi:flagellar motor switch protein FliG